MNTFSSPEEFAKAALDATYRGFLATLNGGVPQTQVVKAATATSREETTVVYRDLTGDARKFLLEKYAKTWLPHRQQTASGYVQILAGQRPA